jgi:hypothetical protein
MPTRVGLASSALPETPTHPGPLSQALVLHQTPHINPPQGLPPATHLTGSSHQIRHPYAPAPTPAANTRGTPTSVQSASPSLPQTPANLGFPTILLHQHQASQGLSSGPEGFYLPTSTPGVYIEYARGPMPEQLTPTHPYPSMQMILSQITPTRTAGYATQPTPTAHSDEAGASSPPQSETVLRYRRMAAKYRAAAETLNLSGDYLGSTKAISNAIDLDRKAHRLQSKLANQIKNRADREEKRRQAAMQASQAMPTAPDVTTSYSPQNEREFKLSSAADDLRGAAALLQMSGDSVGARNAMAEAEPEERQASSLQASNSSSRAMDSRRDSGCPENKAIEHVDAEASKPATGNPEQRTPSSQNRPVRADSLEPKSPSPDEDCGENNAPEQTRSTSSVDEPTPVSTSNYKLTPADNTILGLLKTALELRGVATTLQSSGDTEGAAKSIAEAEAEEGKARELIREEQLRAEDPDVPWTRRDRRAVASRSKAALATAAHECHDGRVLQKLSAALELRGVASELLASGDTDGAAEAINEAEFEERRASKLIYIRAAKKEWTDRRT